jgi:hypothetical protein
MNEGKKEGGKGEKRKKGMKEGMKKEKQERCGGRDEILNYFKKYSIDPTIC